MDVNKEMAINDIKECILTWYLPESRALFKQIIEMNIARQN